LFMGMSGASATPAASGIASAGIADIAREASQVTEVRRRGRHRHRRHRHRRHRYYGGPFIGYGFGRPYYYGGFYGGYPYGYYDDYYYRPRVRRSYRRSYRGSRSCRRAHRACVRNWGYGGGNYAGCMRYERCRPR
jgi:hypothetical protein